MTAGPPQRRVLRADWIGILGLAAFLGGLTVVRELLALLPAEAVLYLGDTARVPYGAKSTDELIRFNREIVRILAAPEMQERLRQLGSDPVGNSPAEFAAFIKSEHDKWAKVIRQAGIKAP